MHGGGRDTLRLRQAEAAEQSWHAPMPVLWPSCRLDRNRLGQRAMAAVHVQPAESQLFRLLDRTEAGEDTVLARRGIPFDFRFDTSPMASGNWTHWRVTTNLECFFDRLPEEGLPLGQEGRSVRAVGHASVPGLERGP